MIRRRSLAPAAALTGAMMLAAGCQDSNPAALDDATPQASRHANTPAAQVWNANLQPLNGHVSFRPVHGNATVRVHDSRVIVTVHATGLEPEIPHPQHIHGFLGGDASMCPTMAADGNEDGVVDVVEGLPDYGGILVTLDSDITNGAGTEAAGLPTTSNAAGTIRYEMSAPLSEVEDGLGGALDPAHRTIVLHGVDPETDLADAQSIGALPAWLTLPVACGELSRGATRDTPRR